jgi:hypothetical protein
MHFKYLIALILGLAFFSSCDSGKSTDPNSTGKGSEILVVCDKVLWDGHIGNSIKQYFTVEMEGLPESEAEYSLINVPYSNFSRFLQTHRNVFIIDVKKENGKGGIETQTNTWSHPQRVIKLIASDYSSFDSVFLKYRAAIKELFNQNERARFSAQNALNRNLNVESILEKEFGIKMVVSSDFYQAKKEKDFIWLRKETNEMSLGLMIYYFPYNDTNQLLIKNILTQRNEYTRKYIPGPTEGSFMKVADEVLKPVSRKIKFNKLFAVETRGLWDTKGDFMGGPYINYSVIDTLRQRIVTFDGYIYYPNKPKKNYVRQLESIIWGASFLPPAPAK